jgi:probable DNA metabolism protein
VILIYDSSIDGFFTLVYEVYYNKLKPTQILKSKPNELLFEDILEIFTDKTKSQKVQSAIKKKFTKKNHDKIKNIFFCDNHDFEIYLLQFIIIGFKDQKQLSNINHSCVLFIDNLLKQFFQVVHKMKGFTRFIELENGFLYAKLENEFNIVPFLAKHFITRFNNQDFVIHDTLRQISFIKDKNNTSIQNIVDVQLEYSQNEQQFQKLWQTFFDSVTIKERKNLKLQRQMVPIKYRKDMTEFKEY